MPICCSMLFTLLPPRCRFCPSVFFYLLSVVPAIWFLEIHEMEKRIRYKGKFNVSRALNDTATEDLRASIDSLGVSGSLAGWR